MHYRVTICYDLNYIIDIVADVDLQKTSRTWWCTPCHDSLGSDCSAGAFRLWVHCLTSLLGLLLFSALKRSCLGHKVLTSAPKSTLMEL